MRGPCCVHNDFGDKDSYAQLSSPHRLPCSTLARLVLAFPVGARSKLMGHKY